MASIMFVDNGNVDTVEDGMPLPTLRSATVVVAGSVVVPIVQVVLIDGEIVFESLDVAVMDIGVEVEIVILPGVKEAVPVLSSDMVEEESAVNGVEVDDELLRAAVLPEKPSSVPKILEEVRLPDWDANIISDHHQDRGLTYSR